MVRSVPRDEMYTMKWFPVRDQIKLTMKITVMMMMMIFPDGSYNQQSHFVQIIDFAKHKKIRKVYD